MRHLRTAAALLLPLVISAGGTLATARPAAVKLATTHGHTASATPSPSPSPSSTATATASPTPTPAPTAAPTPTPAPNSTPAPTTNALPSPTATPTPAPAGPWLGVLQATPANAATEKAAGVSIGELELSWSQYEPQPGVFDSTYAAAQRTRLAQLQQAGLQVTLDLGMQYPPAWIFSVNAATRFVDQYGDAWHGSLSTDVPNAVFDPAVRAAEAAYIARVAVDLGANNVATVRAGGLLQDELRYPDATYNGHGNCYWAFDSNAQAASPVPGWRPGDADSTKASLFLTYYLQSITGFERWLLATYRTSFPTAWLQVLMPSWGLRPGDTDAAVKSDLDGSTPPAQWGTLEMGLDWTDQVAAVPDTHTMLYGTWLERGDDGTTPQTLGPGHYLQTLGQPLGLVTAGENASAGDSVTTMQTIVQRVKSWGLVGLMWLDESSLFGSGPVTLSDLRTAMFS